MILFKIIKNIKTLFIKLHNASIYSDAFAIVFKRYTCMFECKYIIIACEWMCGRCICVLRGEYRDTTPLIVKFTPLVIMSPLRTNIDFFR